MNSTQPGLDWIFNVLYSNPSTCAINIPATFLFQSGLPVRGIVGDENTGSIKPILIQENLFTTQEFRNINRENLQGGYNKSLYFIRHLILEDFKIHNIDNEERMGDPVVCTIFYADGERELLSLSSFDILMRNEAWRKQVDICQAYVYPVSEQIGHYSTQPKVRSRLQTEGMEGVDQLTKVLARTCEQAYTFSESNPIPSMSLASTNSIKKTRIIVAEMQAQFVLDHKGKLIFTNCPRLMISAESNPMKTSDYRISEYLSEERDGRETTAAKTVLHELHSLLHHAQQRGITIENSFSHFDRLGVGFVDINGLVDGLARLGVGVSYSVASLVMQSIGDMGSSFFTMNDFQNFVNRSESEFDFRMMGKERLGLGTALNPSVVSDTSRTRTTTRGTAASQGTRSQSQQPRSQNKSRSGQPSSIVGTSQMSSRSLSRGAWQQPLPPIQARVDTGSSKEREQQQQKQQKQQKQQQQQQQQPPQEDVGQDRDLPLPLSAAAYRVPADSSSSSELPRWALKRHRRALKELKRSQETSSRQKRHTAPELFPSHSQLSNDASRAKTAGEGMGADIEGQNEMASGDDEEGEEGQEDGSDMFSETSSTVTVEKEQRPITANATTYSEKLNLSLQNISEEFTADLKDCPDELLHVDKGVMITYRVVKGHRATDLNNFMEPNNVPSDSILSDSNKKDGSKKPFQDPVLRYKEHLQDRGEKLQSFADSDEQDPSLGLDGDALQRSSSSSFTVVVLPDLFSTLDTLENQLQPLLTRFPSARLVMIGLPGLPNTYWPRGQTLDSDLAARSVYALLVHLKEKRRLFSLRGDPIFFVASGTATLSVTKFIARFLPGMPWLERAVRGLILINPLVKTTKTLRRVFRDLEEALINAEMHELTDLVSSLHFSESFLGQNDRQEVLQRFWHTRRGMNNQKIEGGRGYIGVLEQIRGFLISDSKSTHDDDLRGLLESNIPLVLVGGAEDAFVDPRHTASFLPDVLPEGRFLTEDIQQCHLSGSIRVCWLKAGHEILQERTPYILALLSSLSQNCGAIPATLDHTVEMETDVEGEVLDILELAKRRKEKQAAEKLAAQQALERDMAEAAKRAEEEAVARYQDELDRIAREEDEERRRKEEVEQAQREAELRAQWEREEELRRQREAEEADEQKKLERKRKERERRLELLEARRRREAQNEIQRQLEAMYELERVDKIRKMEADERERMRREDEFSMYAEEYVRDCEAAEASAELAKEKMKQLFQARREEATRRVEDQLARERAKRLEERRRAAEAVVRQIEREQLSLEGQNNGGYEPGDGDHVLQIIAATHRLVQDLVECHHRAVEALKRLQLTREKTNIFLSQCENSLNEMRRLRRAIRMIETSPTLKLMGNDAELAELKENLLHKEEQSQELLSMRKIRESQLSASNRCCVLIKIATRERESILKKRIHELENLERRLSEEADSCRMKKEYDMTRKDALAGKANIVRRRCKVLEDERRRIKEVKEEFVDSDVWVEGVLQRCRTKDLKKYLKDEHHTAKETLSNLEKEMNDLLENILRLSDKQQKCERDAIRLSQATGQFQKVLTKARVHAAEETSRKLLDKQAQAEMIELRKEAEMSTEKKAAKLGARLLADKVRVKDPELRTPDEKRFLGLDLIRNQSNYEHTSAEELEELHFDDAYRCNLTLSDIQRIEQLPEQVALALPFLYTSEEVTAHRLINTYLRGMDEEYFKSKDSRSGGKVLYETKSKQSIKTGFERDMEDDENPEGVTSKHMLEAEVVHDILIKESRRDRIRSLCTIDKMTFEERAWLQLDKLLSPHVYDASELLDVKPPKGRSHGGLDELLYSNAVDKVPGKGTLIITNGTTPEKKVKRHRLNGEEEEEATKQEIRDGDIYEEVRRDYDNGIQLHDDEWVCPFTREQLLELRSKNSFTGAKSNSNLLVKAVDSENGEDDSAFCLRLMDKYFVTESESVLGNAHLKLLQNLSSSISSIFSSEMGSSSSSISIAHSQDQLDGDDSTTTSKESAFRRVWGSWEQVHPASAGIQSQTRAFTMSTYSCTRDHPAAFAIRDHEDEEEEEEEDDEEFIGSSLLSSDPSQLKAIGVDTIRALPSDPTATRITANGVVVGGIRVKNDPNSNTFIVNNVHQLSRLNPRKMARKLVLIQQESSMTIMKVEDGHLQARQSRSLRFEIPDREDVRILDVTVTIVFQGVFGTRGYRLGRIAAGLFRLPDPKDAKLSPLPRSVGYAPYSLQAPNLPESMGRIVILHRPVVTPLRPGAFQIVLGAASSVKYSVEVSCHYAEAALPIIDRLVDKAKEMQSRLPVCLREMEDLHESLVLAERKLLVCDRMIAEADVESQRCRNGMQQLADKLDKDDQTMEMLEDQRREVQREHNILEVEFAQWAMVYASRNQEKTDIKEGLRMMYEFRRERMKEKDKLKKDLDQARRTLPSCVAVLRSLIEASHVAAALNTSVAGPADKMALSASSHSGAGLPRLVTPAENVRKLFRAKGWASLSLEEKQWSMLDQALRPDLYEWLREQDDEENRKRAEQGKRPKKKKFDAAVEAFRHPKTEIQNIIVQPFSMLSRHDMLVRKLLSKFHDDPEMMRSRFAQAAYGFDPHLAERVRGKHPHTLTREEKEWVSLDQALHPEVWHYYQHNTEAKKSMEKDFLRSQLPNDDSTEATEPSQVSNDDRSVAVGSVTAKKGASAAIANATAGKRVHKQQQDILDKVGHLLGMKETLNEKANVQTGDVNLVKIVDDAQKVLTTTGQHWKNPYSRDDLLRIWRSSKAQLQSDDERTAYQLLQKYNGTYGAYIEAQIAKSNRSKNTSDIGRHVKWHSHGNSAEQDVDERARAVLRALEHASSNKNPYMDSETLHNNPQRFPTDELRLELEKELDGILAEQILERERAMRNRVRDDSDTDTDSETGSEGEESKEEARILTKEDIISRKVKARAARREQRRLKLKKEDQEKQVLKMRKMIILKNKSGAALEMATLQNKLGVNGCLACRSNACKWKPCIDESTLMIRRKMLDAEIDRVRANPEFPAFESVIAIGAQNGGNTKYRRDDLLDELIYERKEIDRRIDLNNIDQELHNCYNTRKEYVEVFHLHGYSTILWTNNARRALEARCKRLVAMNVAQEVVDDILDWMLEGWYFGERESSYSVLGYVPSVKKDGMVKSGQDQIQSIGVVTAKMKARQDLKKAGMFSEQSQKGTVYKKALPIESEAQYRLREDKVAKEGTDHKRLLDETESTLKIGLFMLTMMYFRAMAFLRREIRTWGDKDSDGLASGDGSSTGTAKAKLMTDEKRRMLEEERRVEIRKKKMEQVLGLAKVGDQRRRTREQQERREATLKLQALVRRQKLEKESCVKIQKVFRGHLGRKAARRWALKRAELTAMNALLHAAATTVQRYFRGYVGRIHTIETRREMAHFIALMRAQEAMEDEVDYWNTHPLARYKRNAMANVRGRLGLQTGNVPLGGPRIEEEERPYDWIGGANEDEASTETMSVTGK